MSNLKRVFIIDYGTCYLDFDKIELLNCGDGYYFVNRIIEPDSENYWENMSPYYLLLGCILYKQNDNYEAVTLTPFRNAELRETATERDMVTVFVPEDMTEWIGYWVDTLKKWIFVEFLHNDSRKTPRIKHVIDLPKPPEMIHWMHFAEDKDGSLYVVQAFHKGIPWFTETTEEDEESEKEFLPFKFLPRKRLDESDDGTTYVFDNLRIYRVIL